MKFTSPENINFAVESNLNFPKKSYAYKQIIREIVLFEDDFTNGAGKWYSGTVVDDARTETGKALKISGQYGHNLYVNQFIAQDRTSYRMEIDVEVKYESGRYCYIYMGMQSARPNSTASIARPGGIIMFGYYSSHYNHGIFSIDNWARIATIGSGYQKLVYEQVMIGPTTARMNTYVNGMLIVSSTRYNISTGGLRPTFYKQGSYDHLRVGRVKVIQLPDEY